MAGIATKLIELKEELDDSPNTTLSARTGVLEGITLAREFAETRLNALCEAFTGGKNGWMMMMRYKKIMTYTTR